MRRSAPVFLVSACILLGASSARSESAIVNVHLEPGVSIPLPAPGTNPGSGTGVAFKVDYALFDRVVPQLQGSAVAFPNERFLKPGSAFGVGAGVRVRLLDDREGYLLHLGDPSIAHQGNLFGNLWVDASGQVYPGSALRFGFDVGAGAEMSLADGLQIGPFAKFAFLDGSSMVVAGVSISMGVASETAVHDEDPDKDGILGKADKCPTYPEDKDGFKDEDGCPDRDNDEDTIVDEKDGCPDVPEDPDDFEDMDGCPEDNDRDGFADNIDKCPMDPEDKDGFQDDDGCPDPDNDADRIADVQDKCPNEPETYNGKEDQDGCPEKEVRAFVTQKQIVITERVFFDFNKSRILPKSFPLLTSVADLLKQFPQIKKLRVEGHTDDVGSDSYNQTLSDKRAQAVRDFLVKQGVEAGRLESKGYGKTRPLDASGTKEAKDTNRRVEFAIIDPEGGFVPVVETVTVDPSTPQPEAATPDAVPASGVMPEKNPPPTGAGPSDAPAPEAPGQSVPPAAPEPQAPSGAGLLGAPSDGVAPAMQDGGTP